MRSYLEQGDPDTGYKWDYFDGLDELPEKDQEKVKKAVIEGKISVSSAAVMGRAYS